MSLALLCASQEEFQGAVGQSLELNLEQYFVELMQIEMGLLTLQSSFIVKSCMPRRKR